MAWCIENQASSLWSLVLVNFWGPLENEWTPSQMNIFCSCHRSWQKMNTSSSEHLVSQVTTHEQLVEIVQYSSDLSCTILSYCNSRWHVCQPLLMSRGMHHDGKCGQAIFISWNSGICHFVKFKDLTQLIRGSLLVIIAGLPRPTSFAICGTTIRTLEKFLSGNMNTRNAWWIVVGVMNRSAHYRSTHIARYG